MSDDWPPQGHNFAIRMDVCLEDPQLSYSAEITTPSASAVADIATFGWGRLGGPSGDDEEFRTELYRRIGAVTVAGGHAEAAMKRVLLVTEAKQGVFADVDLTWSDLVKRLRRVAAGTHELADGISQILRRAEEAGAKQRRDDVVHAYWWNYAGMGVSRSRFTRDGRSFITTSDLATLDEDAKRIFTFAGELDDLVEGTWPQARLLTSPQDVNVD